MALTLNGSTHWPTIKDLQRFGETRMGGSPARVSAILERITDAMSEVASVMKQYIKTHPEFEQIGSLMMSQWQAGATGLLTG